jgi:hypothetical protein
MKTDNPYKVVPANEYSLLNWKVTGPHIGKGISFPDKEEAIRISEHMFSAYVAGVRDGQKSIAPHLF